jgi:signal transduction histidine kinase
MGRFHDAYVVSAKPGVARLGAVPYRNIADPARLRRLLEAALLLEADLSLPALLRHLVEEARSMTGARYGALGVLDSTRTRLAEFITVGISPEDEAAIDHRPQGLGLLGLLIADPKPLRLADLHQHAESVGFPAGHPPMRSFLGVPVMAHDEVYGNLYLTEKVGWSEFTQDDEDLVRSLAVAAGIAIENARLHARAQDAALLEDRDRIARDLHDAVIQRLFAVGLSLQGIVTRQADSPEVLERLQRAIHDIDETIRQIRSSIFDLGALGVDEHVRSNVAELVRELRPVVGFHVPVMFSGPVDTAISGRVAEHLLFATREALTNVGRHAEATEASVSISVTGDMVTLEITDNGRGIGEGGSDTTGLGGFGLINLRNRAEKLGGELVLNTPGTGGTSLVWRVPIRYG